MSWTKGKHQFIVATHIAHAHIHTHIIYNSTRIDGRHKYRNFFGSSFALRRARKQAKKIQSQRINLKVLVYGNFQQGDDLVKRVQTGMLPLILNAHYSAVSSPHQLSKISLRPAFI